MRQLTVIVTRTLLLTVYRRSCCWLSCPTSRVFCINEGLDWEWVAATGNWEHNRFTENTKNWKKFTRYSTYVDTVLEKVINILKSIFLSFLLHDKTNQFNTNKMTWKLCDAVLRHSITLYLHKWNEKIKRKRTEISKKHVRCFIFRAFDTRTTCP